MSRSSRRSRSQRSSKHRPSAAVQETTAGHARESEESKATIKSALISANAALKAAYIGAAAVIVAGTIPLIISLWPKGQPPEIKIESTTLDVTPKTEIITVNGLETNLQPGDLIFTVATFGVAAQSEMLPQTPWVVGSPAYFTPDGTWTSQLVISPPFLGKLSIIAGIVPCSGRTRSSCETNLPVLIAQARARLQSLGPNGLEEPSAPRYVPHPAPLLFSSQAASRLLLTASEIERITGARLIGTISAINRVSMLDLSVGKAQYIRSCRIATGSLSAPFGQSPIKASSFGIPNLGTVEIGERVASYKLGQGERALIAVDLLLQRCGFHLIQMDPYAAVGFTLAPLKGQEWEFKRVGDVLIEVVVSRPSQSGPLNATAVLSKLATSIEARVDRLEPSDYEDLP